MCSNIAMFLSICIFKLFNMTCSVWLTSFLHLNSHQWQQMKLTKQYIKWLLMPVLIPHLLAMEDFQRVYAHQLMSACAMEYLILASYRLGLLWLPIDSYRDAFNSSLIISCSGWRHYKHRRDGLPKCTLLLNILICDIFLSAYCVTDCRLN